MPERSYGPDYQHSEVWPRVDEQFYTTTSTGWICHGPRRVLFKICVAVYKTLHRYTAWRLSIWRSCAGLSPTSRGAVTSALQRVDFYSHLAITYQRTEDEPFLMLVHLPGIFFQNICGHLIWHLTALGTAVLILFLFTQMTHAAHWRLFSDSELYKFSFYILHLHLYKSYNLLPLDSLYNQ